MKQVSFLRGSIKVYILLASLLCGAVDAAFSQSLEQVMRELQARHELRYGEGKFHEWPRRSDGAFAPYFPPDGFYDIDIKDRHRGAMLVQNAAYVLWDCVYYTDYIVGDPEGQASVTNLRDNARIPYPPNVGTENYREELAQMDVLWRQMTKVRIILETIPGKTYSLVRFFDAKSPDNARVQAGEAWDNLPPGANLWGDIWFSTHSASIPWDVNGVTLYAVNVGCLTGTLSADFGWIRGSTKVYLIARPLSNQPVPVKVPTGVVDGRYHLWKTVDQLGVWQSEDFLDRVHVPLEWCGPPGGGGQPEDQSHPPISYGWELRYREQIGIKEPQFKTDPDGECGGCRQNCAPGEGNASIGSLRYGISLGLQNDGRPAGRIEIHERTPSSRLEGPAALKLFTDHNVSDVVTAGGIVRQVKTQQMLADIESDPSLPMTWRIRCFSAGEIGNKVGGIYDQTGRTPYITHTFTVNRRASDGGFESFGIMASSSTLGDRRQRFVWTEVPAVPATGEAPAIPAQWVWTLQSLNNSDGILRQERVVETVDSSGRRCRTEEVLDPEDHVLSRATTTYGAGELVSQVVQEVAENLDATGNSAGPARVTTYNYHAGTDLVTGARAGMLAERYEGSGRSWVQYGYDSFGRVNKIRTQFRDSPRECPDSECRVETIDYSSELLDGDIYKEEVSVHTTRLLGSVTTRRVNIYWGNSGTDLESGYNYNEEWMVDLPNNSFTSVADALVAPGRLVTKTRYYSSGDARNGRVRSVLNPDGTMRVWSYEGGLLTQTFDVGAANAAGTLVASGTRTVRVQNARGGLVSETTTDITTQRILGQTVATNHDEFGRPQSFSYLDGTVSTQSFNCCGVASETDREGNTTDYGYDDLKRRTSSTKNGIRLQETLDALGRSVKTQRIVGESATTLSTRSYRGDGSVISESDAGNRVTTTSETFDSGGHRVVTTTSPDNGTRIETYYLDGTPRSISGSAVALRRWEYGLDGDGAFTKEFRAATDAEFVAETETEWVKTSTDFFGRAYLTAFADGSSAQESFDSNGRRWRSADPDGVATLFEYNSLGELTTTAVDVNQSKTINLNGSDRITRSTRSYVTRTSGVTTPVPVERTITEVWAVLGDATPSEVSSVDVSLDGLRRWETTHGVTTLSETSYPTGGGRVETTTLPDGTQRRRTFAQGRLTSEESLSTAGVVLTRLDLAYDEHGRLETQTDGRNSVTTYTYRTDDLLASVTTADPDSSKSGVGYDPQTTTFEYDTAGRRSSVANPDGTTVTTTYWENGQIKLVSGARTYPQKYTYDRQNRVKTLTTWQDYAGLGGAAVTTWNYHPQRGWLQNKRYNDNHGPDYTYTDAGRLATRQWARSLGTSRLTTTYSYSNSGDLQSISYSDATPSVSVTFDRLGRRNTVTDAAGVLTYGYQGLTSLVETESYAAGGGALAGQGLTRTFDSLHRFSGYSAPSALGATYSYSSTTGRLSSVTSAGMSHSYGYLPNSELVETLTQAKSGGATLLTTRAYDAINRLSAITMANQGTAVRSTAYGFNNANQRVLATEESGEMWDYGYDALGQVISGAKKLPNQTPILGHGFNYTFDDIGNRESASNGGASSNYTANLLNQYEQRSVPNEFAVTGTAAAAAQVSVNLLPADRQGERFHRLLTEGNNGISGGNATTARWEPIRVDAVRPGAGAGGADLIATQTGHAFVPQSPELFQYDLDGNLTQDGRWKYTWDAENRLIQMETIAAVINPGVPKQKLVFTYDASSRRVAKQIFLYGRNQWNLSGTSLFQYDGWNLVAEYSMAGGVANYPLAATYLWGIDLSGSLQGAGGVGGLLAVSHHLDANGAALATPLIRIPAYDGNGNIRAYQAIDDGSEVASFSYGPFGELITADGVEAVRHHFRFSSKWQDSETGLNYFGFRYYNPGTGRWIRRDPIAERGGLNLVGMLQNNPLCFVDILGLGFPGDPMDPGTALAEASLFEGTTGATTGATATTLTSTTLTSTATGVVAGGGASGGVIITATGSVVVVGVSATSGATQQPTAFPIRSTPPKVWYAPEGTDGKVTSDWINRGATEEEVLARFRKARRCSYLYSIYKDAQKASQYFRDKMKADDRAICDLKCPELKKLLEILEKENSNRFMYIENDCDSVAWNSGPPKDHSTELSNNKKETARVLEYLKLRGCK